jgi:hypothetical protein
VDPLTRRALLRALAAFLAVLVIGSATVSAVGALRDLGPDPVAEPSPSASILPGAPLPEAWLVWVPGGLPEGFGEQLTLVNSVDDVTVATADIAWMESSVDDDGIPVDSPSENYLIPIDVTGVEPAFTAFVPQPERALVASLEPGEGILSESAARLRKLGEGARMSFPDDRDITIIGTLPDALMGGYELLTTRPTAEQIGASRERYALFHVREGLSPDPGRLAALFEPYAIESPYGGVEVRAPGQARFLRANDRELPPALLKQRFGEFTAIPDLDDPGPIQVDPAWVQEHIESQELPVVGTLTCHADALAAIRRAMKKLLEDGDEDAVTDVGDCYEAIADPDDPNGPLTSRAFGASLSLNPAENDDGDPAIQDEALVVAMAKAGFGWGGVDAYPQGALFRYARLPPKQG